MFIFIRLKNKDRIKLFNLVKRKINSSWNIFYPSLKISRTMFFNYLSGRYNLPKDLFLKLQKIAKVEIKDYLEIRQNRYTKKRIVEPKMSNSLAEILGVLNGDGHISRLQYEVNVVSDSREKDYSNYLKRLFERTFKISFSFYKEPSRTKLRTYSIDLSNLLTKKYGLPKGNKLHKLRIPKQVFSSKNLLRNYIKGLFDTDGSFYIRRKKDPVLEISSADKRFLGEIKKTLNVLDFNAAKGVNKVVIYRKEDIKRFFKVIKPANPKHLKNYQNYLSLIKRR